MMRIGKAYRNMPVKWIEDGFYTSSFSAGGMLHVALLIIFLYDSNYVSQHQRAIYYLHNVHFLGITDGKCQGRVLIISSCNEHTMLSC